MSLDGLSVPTPTLFQPDGSLDPGRNSTFCRTLSEAKVDHLFVLGSLGEFPSVTEEERARLVDVVIESVTGATDVWVGVGAPSTRQALAYADSAESLGAAALVAVPPYYLHPSLPAIERYYRAIHETSRLPLLAYNIPSLVGYALPPALVHRLGREKVLAGVKDTAGSLASVSAFLEGAPEGFAVLPGDDVLASGSIANGAAGAVMGTANLVPKLCVELVRAARAPDAAAVVELQPLVDALVDVTHAAPFPANDKFLAHHLWGADVGYRAPYDAPTADEERALLERLAPLAPRLAPFLRR